MKKGETVDRYLTPMLVAGSLTIVVAGQYLLKTGMNIVGRVDSASKMFSKDFLVAAATQWQVPVALMMYALGAFLWMVVLSRENLSYVYPFLGLTYVGVLAIGHFALGEDITLLRLLGTLLVAAGVVLVARS